MSASYKKLWINKDMKKNDLQILTGISQASVTKMSKGENVSTEALLKVCRRSAATLAISWTQ